MHTGVIVGKEVTAGLYGKAHSKSYYLGCSTGGRQGFKAVQEYADDFDGVVAGAPALDFTNLINWSGSFYGKTGAPNSTTFLSTEQRFLVNEMVLAQCDALDGSVDGLIEDPSLCNPRPEALICSTTTTSSTDCLSSAQVASVRDLFSPLYGQNGSLLYPRLEPGADAFAPGGLGLIVNGSPFPYTVDWYRYVVYNDATFDAGKLTAADYAACNAKTPYISTWKGDLTAFQQRGGKVLTYHGTVDSLISLDNSARYYEHVSRTMSLPSSALDHFYRYFRISGMAHCSGGPGAWQIGNQAVGNATLEAEGNVLMAMVRWVEEGVGPETVTGTKFVNDSKVLGVEFRRRHCRYPQRNVFQGGDAKSADSWRCV
ncbi:tannase and feruloyl esterase [Pseudovirgaria hyperparasitica]|uniref:Carboxylic ester hydrolase n=1 Tax=Pseudovirgaria hyperparasitica TaxID=470096 RepID=A0A6A6WCK4_9PEZI|nr:tannase and feruloyl esterase [Pseudovirgaria hyperparasitica]KAF2758841.1 tannase and feruloyl esterase [Pseudovirgaria hyperparasitica]